MPPQSVDHGYDDRAATVAITVTERKGAFFVCFIDIQKAYDSDDRPLLRQALTRIGVPPEMIAVIRQFHDAMRAWVWPDSGESSGWFEVRQGVTTRKRALTTSVQRLLRGCPDHWSKEVQLRTERSQSISCI